MRHSQIKLILFVLALGILSFSCSITGNSLGGEGSSNAPDTPRSYAKRSSSSQAPSSSSTLVIVRSSSSNQPTYIGDTSQPQRKWEVSQDQNNYLVCTETPCASNIWSIPKNQISWRPNQDTNHLDLLKILDLRSTSNLSLGSAQNDTLSGLALQLELLWYKKINASSLQLLGGNYYLTELTLKSVNLIGTSSAITRLTSNNNFDLENSNLYQLSIYSIDTTSHLLLKNTRLKGIHIESLRNNSQLYSGSSAKPWILLKGGVYGEDVEVIVHRWLCKENVIQNQETNQFTNAKFSESFGNAVSYKRSITLDSGSALTMNQVRFDLTAPIYMNANTSLDWTYGSLSAALTGNVQLIKLRNLEFLGSFAPNAPTPTCFNSYNKNKNLNGFCL